MADFVAVIRRAVDGLANNTPEMRIRVYEKARGAVQRQLESMKPQPSEDMLRRQMEKLDAAIRDVEAEHREATPPDEGPVLAAVTPEEALVEAVPDQTAEPLYDAQDADSASSPVAEEPEYQAHQQPEDVIEPQASYADYHEQPAPEPLPAQPYDVAAGHYQQDAAPEWVAEQPAAAAYDNPEHGYDQAGDRGHVPSQGEIHREAGDPFADEDDQSPTADGHIHNGHFEQTTITTDETVVDSNAWVQPAQDDADERLSAADEAPVEAYEPPVAQRPVSVAPAWPDAPSTAPVVTSYSQSEPVVDWVPEELPTLTPRAVETPAWADEADYQDDKAERSSGRSFDDSAAAELFSAHFDEQTHVAAEARMPPVSDFPDLDPAPSDKPEPQSHDPFADFVNAAPEPAAAKPQPQSDPDPWNDLEELIGYDKTKAATGAAAGVAAGVVAAKVASSSVESRPRDQQSDNQELEELMAQPVARPYRVAPKPKRNYVGILLGVLGLALLAGGGYAIWLNRDALSGLIGGADSPAPATQQASQPAQQPASGGTPAAKPQQPATQTAATPATQTPPAAKPGEPQKFTQRLMPDGTEKDSGSGGPSGAAGNQSVAQLNAPGTAPQAPAGNAASPATGAPAVAAPGAATPGVPPASQPANTVAVAGNKIFLYEERVGQSSPTAVEGSVSWSLQKEAVENGKTEPAVQGRISIPGRGLTALVTFKRNTDASLPASHLVEFVFSLPPNFEGGSIDSVQRISMKQTEQDRGDPLVAVPAKITPDFHMIALNDFPDARARNLDLIKSRDWIDVPLIYSNGRRALLTMQKGDDGRKAFEEAVRVWQAAAPQQGQ